MGFNLENYETVEDRLRRFWADHPEGRVSTSIHHYDDSKVVFRAEVFLHKDDQHPVATGYAEEVRGASPVNKTSHVENAETSAIGRALANCNYAPKGARPSREEMSKVQRQAPTYEQEAEELGVEDVKRMFNATEVSTKQVRNVGDPASKPQMGKISAVCMKLRYSKQQKFDLASQIAGRPISDLAEMSKGEASRMIQKLEELENG